MSHIIDNNATSQDKHFRKGVYNNNNRYYSLMEGDEHKDARKSKEASGEREYHHRRQPSTCILCSNYYKRKG